MKYRLEIEVRLAFAQPVREHHGELRLVPRNDEVQRCGPVQIVAAPAANLATYTDWFGNRVDSFDVIAPHDSLAVRVDASVETLLENPFGFAPLPVTAERAWLAQAMARDPRLGDYALVRGGLDVDGAPAWGSGQPLLDAVLAARDWVAENAADAAEGDAGAAAGARVLELLEIVRGWGVPARYVAGFEDVEGEGGGREGLHAWCEVLVPGAGWRGFDPLYGLVVNDHYVAVSVGRDAGDAPLLRQVVQGGIADPASLRLQLKRQEQ